MLGYDQYANAWYASAHERSKTELHTVSLQYFLIKPIYFKNEIIDVNVSKTKGDVFVAIVLSCSRWNLLMFIHYLCNVFYFLRKRWKNKKNVKT